MISDSEKRKIYDQFGEEGLKGGVPPGGAGGFPGGANGFPGGGVNFGPGGGQSFRYSPRSANDIFAEVTGRRHSRSFAAECLCGHEFSCCQCTRC